MCQSVNNLTACTCRSLCHSIESRIHSTGGTRSGQSAQHGSVVGKDGRSITPCSMTVATTASATATTRAPITSITSTACIRSSRCTITTGTSDPSRLPFSGRPANSAGARISSDNR